MCFGSYPRKKVRSLLPDDLDDLDTNDEHLDDLAMSLGKLPHVLRTSWLNIDNGIENLENSFIFRIIHSKSKIATTATRRPGFVATQSSGTT